MSDKYLKARLRKRRNGKKLKNGCTPKSYIPGGFESAIPETHAKTTLLTSRTASKRKWVQSTRVRKTSLSEVMCEETGHTDGCQHSNII